MPQYMSKYLGDSFIKCQKTYGFPSDPIACTGSLLSCRDILASAPVGGPVDPSPAAPTPAASPDGRGGDVFGLTASASCTLGGGLGCAGATCGVCTWLNAIPLAVGGREVPALKKTIWIGPGKQNFWALSCHYFLTHQFKNKCFGCLKEPSNFVCLFVLLLYVPSQQLWSLQDGQFS